MPRPLARVRSLAWQVGLGLLVGAVLHQPLAAQQRDTTRAPKRDTTRVRRDTVAVPKQPARAPGDTIRVGGKDTTVVTPTRPRADSLLLDSLRKMGKPTVPLPAKPLPEDSIKAPLARAPAPTPIEIAESYRWDRAEIFATGAITLADLLERIPGVTALHSGWIAAPMADAYLGDVRRVRVFYDGVELDELDRHANGALDLSQVPLWSAEEVRVERSPTEIRVHIRSWRVDNRRPYTRVDINTGDQNTNLYRGFFGRRYTHGEAVQFAAQQFGTTPGRFGASSDQLSILARLGLARGRWSVDATMLRGSRHFGTIYGLTNGDSLHGFEASRLDSRLRLAYGDPDSGPWAQAIASGTGYTRGPPTGQSTGFGNVVDTSHAPTDTSNFRAQYVLATGLRRWGLDFTAIERLRVFDRRTIQTPSLRGEWILPRLAVSGFVEGKGPDSVSRTEVTGRLTPLSFVSFLGSIGHVTEPGADSSGSSRTTTYVRLNAGLRIRDLWVVGGVIRRDPVALAAPLIFDSLFTRRVDPAATGATLALRGTLYKALKANVSATRWNDSSGFYRPRYQTRSELYVSSRFLNRFPSGDFGVLASIQHEYRSTVRFPVGDSAVSTVPGYRTISALLEIRILSAVLQYQFRNLLAEPYYTVPRFLMPRQTQFYGVRWEFWD